MSHAENVAHLRTLARLNPDTTVLEDAIVAVLEAMATAVDRLEAQHPHPPETEERGLGSI